MILRTPAWNSVNQLHCIVEFRRESRTRRFNGWNESRLNRSSEQMPLSSVLSNTKTLINLLNNRLTFETIFSLDRFSFLKRRVKTKDNTFAWFKMRRSPITKPRFFLWSTIEKVRMAALFLVELQSVRLGLISSMNNASENHLLYVIVVPLCLLGLIVFLIFCCRHRRRKSTRDHRHHSHCSDSIKSSIKPRQPFIHPTGAVMPSNTTRTSNDYIATSVDSIPIARQYQQRYALPLSSDMASLTSSNLYYARVQALWTSQFTPETVIEKQRTRVYLFVLLCRQRNCHLYNVKRKRSLLPLVFFSLLLSRVSSTDICVFKQEI